MSTERPNFCIEIDCPYYPGYGPCRLKQWTIDGWSSRKRRREMLERYEELVANDHQQVIKECLEKSFERWFTC